MVWCVVCLYPVFRVAGWTVGESRAPVLAGVVDGDAYGRRYLVGGIDVHVTTLLSRHAPGEPLF